MEKITFTDELDFGKLTLVSARELCVVAMVKMMEENPNIMFISGENVISSSPFYVEFKAKNHQRFIEVGIAEPNQVGIAAGMALSGKTVFTQGFGPFLALRCLEQINIDVAYHNLPIRMIDTHSGLTAGGGPTHYNIMDITVMRGMPNMTVICPSDANQCQKVIFATKDIPGPVFIRLPRGAEPLVYTTQDYDFQIGKAVVAHEGNDITIFATGSTVAFAVSAANGLEKKGIHARVIDMHTVTPIDRDIIIKAAIETKKIITVEDHLVTGGLGSAVSEVITDEGLAVKIKRLGIPGNDFPPLGDMYELYKLFGFCPEGIKKTVYEMLGGYSGK
jgi:transketolase